MPDICMCSNKECPMNSQCYRFLATPSEYWQTYADFKPNSDGKCDNFWPINLNGIQRNKVAK